jgi:hypothetical protein
LKPAIFSPQSRNAVVLAKGFRPHVAFSASVQQELNGIEYSHPCPAIARVAAAMPRLTHPPVTRHPSLITTRDKKRMLRSKKILCYDKFIK